MNQHAATSLPPGPVTLLFTDVAGSTRGWEAYGNAYGSAIARHFTIIQSVIEDLGGQVFKTVGDQVCSVFVDSEPALRAAVRIQRNLLREHWPEPMSPIEVRIALHRGHPVLRERDYFGPPVNRVARLLSAAHPRQVLVSSAVQESLQSCPDGFRLKPLGLHRLKDLANAEALFQVTARGLPSDFPAPKALDVRPHHFPVHSTSFVGREQEMERLEHWLTREDARLLTLLGPPGVGKTRLALQFASRQAYRFPEGVWLVELAAVHDPSMVAQQILTALDKHEGGSRSAEDQVCAALGDRDLLLICDNFEHVLPAFRVLKTILETSRNVRILVTSRSLLHIAGEGVLELQPLETPKIRGTVNVEDLARSPATALFLDRARAARPGWEPSAPEAHLIVDLCQSLDGLPLALELAAARMRAMTLAEIRNRLSDRFRLLAAERSDLPDRQKTLRAALDWSFELLSPQEQRTLAALSVFRGGFSLEAAEAVCDEGDVWETLPALQDHSFVFGREQTGTMRFNMLEAVREYALTHLGTGENLKREAHALYFLPLAEAAAASTGTAAEESAFSTLDRDVNNMRAAMDWSCRAQRVELCARLTAATSEFLRCRGLWRERLQRITTALEPAREYIPDAAVTGWLGFHEAFALRDLGHLDEAEVAAHEALAQARSHEDGRLESRLLNLLGMIAVQRTDLSTAADWYHEALTKARAVSDAFSAASALVNLGRLAVEAKDWIRARSLYEDSLPFWRDVESMRGMATALNGLGIVHFEAAKAGAADHARFAIRLYREALDIQRQLVNLPSVALLMNNIAEVLEMQNETERALVLFAAAESMLRDAGSPNADYVASGVHRTAERLPEARAASLIQEAQYDPWEVARNLDARLEEGTGQQEGLVE